MRRLSVCGLALAAVLSLAACGGGGDSVSEGALTLGEIRELTGLSAPTETPEAQQERSLDIFPRADSLVLSTMHGETDNDVFPAFRHLTECSGARCTATDPLSGAVYTIELFNTPLRHGAATAIGSKHGITLLTYQFPTQGSGHTLDAAFGGIRNIDRGTAHAVETVLFENVAVAEDGTFARGQSGARIQGGFHGPGHAEAAGIFEQSDVVGAFGARRQ